MELKLDLKILRFFKEKILNFIRSRQNGIVKLHNPLVIKLLTLLGVGLSYLKEHKFNHNFQDSLDPSCSCGNSIECTVPFPLYFKN